MERIVGRTRLVLVEGDITRQDVDAIVNAANPSLLGGGGVDGAIHRAGGPQILEECRAVVARQGRCPAGQAVVTGGGRLKARHVIHAVGPVWHGGSRGEDDLLRSAYINCLRLALSVAARSLAFPSISTGAYGFPIERAARIAFEAVRELVREECPLDEVRFVTFSRGDFLVYARRFDLK
ncbi:MAG: O-acetyl-ADP-ribose deacetylase [Acidobacteria bacterium 13_1_40CM_2_68_5]|nr:MAG: O-acetyl-ADP-ribose deacetylase [Acidobacteria bacterium 13_1_40CM_2_68_5]